MSILVSCACGKSYPIKEQFAGKKVQCPGCKKVLTVPGSTMSAAVAAPPASAAMAPAPNTRTIIGQPMDDEDVVDLPLNDDGEILDVVAPAEDDDDVDEAPRRKGNGMLIGILAFAGVLLL